MDHGHGPGHYADHHHHSAIGDGSPLAFELQQLGTTPELTPSPVVAPFTGRLDARGVELTAYWNPLP